MEWYQAHRCSDGRKSQEFMFGKKARENSDYTRLAMRPTKHTYDWDEHSHTWNYLSIDIKLIYKGE